MAEDKSKDAADRGRTAPATAETQDGMAASKRSALSRIRIKGTNRSVLDAIAEAESEQAKKQARIAAAREAAKTAVSFDEMASEFGFGNEQDGGADGQGDDGSVADSEGGATRPGSEGGEAREKKEANTNADHAAEGDGEQRSRPLPTSVRIGIVAALSLSAVLMIAGRTMANALLTGASIVGLAGTIVAYVAIARRLNYHALTEEQIDEKVDAYRADLIATLNGYSLQGKYTDSDIDDLCREYREEIEAENVSVADIGLPSLGTGRKKRVTDAEAIVDAR